MLWDIIGPLVGLGVVFFPRDDFGMVVMAVLLAGASVAVVSRYGTGVVVMLQDVAGVRTNPTPLAVPQRNRTGQYQ